MIDLYELIAEARHEESIQDKLGDGFSEGSEERAFYYEHRDRYKRLADALEAATSGPSGDGEYLLSVIETIKQTGGSVEIHGVKIMPCDEFGRTAAVPDAATDAREYLHAKCDCVPDLGPAHCHLCSADGSPVEWANCVAVQQVTDAPETVEVAFKTVEVERLGHLLVQLSPATPRNGAATVRRLMEEMNIKEVVS